MDVEALMRKAGVSRDPVIPSVTQIVESNLRKWHESRTAEVERVEVEERNRKIEVVTKAMRGVAAKATRERLAAEATARIVKAEHEQAERDAEYRRLEAKAIREQAEAELAERDREWDIAKAALSEAMRDAFGGKINVDVSEAILAGVAMSNTADDIHQSICDKCGWMTGPAISLEAARAAMDAHEKSGHPEAA